MQLDHFHQLLAQGVRAGASDVHFRPGARPSYRIRKRLIPSRNFPVLTPQDTAELAQEVVQGSAVAAGFDGLREVDLSYAVAGLARFRVNVYRQRGSLGLVFRIIPNEIPTLEALGLPPIVQHIANVDRGLVLVTGATGAGKSSTLAGIIRHINETRMSHIVTIEDPIEFLHKNDKASLSQREIGIDTESFVSGLRAALRQDPDVILVGEMRDAESIDIALKAAETGHAVYSTLHTTDAQRTIGRILSSFDPRDQAQVRSRLSENLQAIISQRLLPRDQDHGMCPAVEILRATEAVRQVILEPTHAGALKELIEEGGEAYGMQTFDQHLTRLYRDGVISKEIALQAATSAADFERNLHFDG